MADCSSPEYVDQWPPGSFSWYSEVTGCTGSLFRSNALVMFRQAFSMRMWSNEP